MQQKLLVTAEHPLWTAEGWGAVGTLVVGNVVGDRRDRGCVRPSPHHRHCDAFLRYCHETGSPACDRCACARTRRWRSDRMTGGHDARRILKGWESAATGGGSRGDGGCLAARGSGAPATATQIRWFSPTGGWFSSTGSVVIRGAIHSVFVGGLLLGEFDDRDRDRSRRNVLVVTVAKSGVHLGRLAAAFGIGEEYLRELRRKEEAAGRRRWCCCGCGRAAR